MQPLWVGGATTETENSRASSISPNFSLNRNNLTTGL